MTTTIGYLYSVPPYADADDGKLRDPTVSGGLAKSGAAPLTGVGAVTANGQKNALSAAPMSGAGAITANGGKASLSAAPLTGAGNIIAFTRKEAQSSAPLSGVGNIIAAGEAGASAPSGNDWFLRTRRRRRS